MLEIDNQTPYDVALIPCQDKTGRDAAVIVVKGTFTVGTSGSVATLADEQRPIVRADTFHGEPSRSSVRYEADTCPGKQGADVVLLGHAYAPQRASSVDVELRVGALRKLLRVTGDRVFGKSTVGWSISEAAPIERIPLVYERAFGGEDRSSLDPTQHEWMQHNPVGVGFVAQHSLRDHDGQRLPNIEHPNAPLRAPTDRPPAAGFGFIARHWLPRRAYAGSYDERWQRERAPLLPDDFDERFHNGAPPDQITPAPLRGGEKVSVSGVQPGGGALELTLPSRRIGVSATIKGVSVDCPPQLDTLLIDADDRRVVLVWRALVPCGRELLYVDKVEITDAAG